MNRLAICALVAAGCTGTTYRSGLHPAQVVRPSVETVDHTRSTAARSVYQPPDPADMQIDPRCHPTDSLAMCEALVVMLDMIELDFTSSVGR